jgi:hypothetical protein
VTVFLSSANAATFTDVDYNPDVSPYIYCTASQFVTPTTTNTLYIIDPSNPNPAMWTAVKVVDLSTSLNTCREIALGPDGYLYLGQFAQGGSPQLYVDRIDLDPNNDGNITLAETMALADNSSVNCYSLNGGVGASFVGLDMAHGPSGPTCGPCGDSNCDGSVTVGDIGFFVRAVSAGTAGWNALFPGGVAPCDFVCANDTNGDNAVSVGDIGRFVARLSAGTACP